MPQNRSASNSKSFVQETTIHGIKEAWLIKNKPIRFLWMFILIGCFCGVTYEIYQIVRYYRSNPSASQVKWVIKDMYDYPPMVFCPKTFLSLAKVKRLNMSKNALAYTVSLFQTVFQPNLPPGFQLDKARAEVKAIMQRNGLKTYVDLFGAIAFDGKDIMYDALTQKTIKLEVYVPGYGLCYRMHLPPVKASTIKSINRLELEHIPSENLTEYDFIHDAALLVRDTTGVKADMIMLSKKAYYQIDFQVQLHKRLSRPGMECLNADQVSENYYVTDCEVACLDMEKFNSGCSKCLPYQMLNSFNSTIEPCADIRAENIDIFINDSEACSQDAIIARSKACLSECIPVCEQWMFKHSTLIFDNHNLSMYIRLLYNPSDGILTYEEVPTYNFDTFISNIGGQLGLWLGASVVSIFQIFYYACVAMFNREEKSVSKI